MLNKKNMHEISLSDSDDEYLNADIWGTFDNESCDDMNNIEEIIWSRSYENFIRHGNVTRKFVPWKVQDINDIRSDLNNISVLLLDES